MQIDTTRFGKIEVDQARMIHFPKGLVGFSDCRDYALIEAGEAGTFWWLQCATQPDLAFVVTDPAPFVPTYRVPIKPDQAGTVAIESEDDAQVLVIVNKREHMLTGNLQGPLVINLKTRRGEQLVLSDRRFTTRAPLVELSSPVPQAVSA